MGAGCLEAFLSQVELVDGPDDKLVLRCTARQRKLLTEECLGMLQEALGSLEEDPEIMIITSEESAKTELFPRAAHLQEGSFENFLVGDSNRMAWGAAMKVAECPGTVYNPLVLYGGPGVGKSHLLTAIANELLRKDPEQVVYLTTADGFVKEMVTAVSNGTQERFRERCIAADALLLDDLQSLQGKPATQEMLLKILEEMVALGKQVVIGGSTSLRDLEGFNPRLLSHMSCGLQASIAPMDWALRESFLQKQAAFMGMELTDEEQEIAASRSGDARVLLGELNTIHAFQTLDLETLFP